MSNDSFRVGPCGRHLAVHRAVLVAAFPLALLGACNQEEGGPDVACGPGTNLVDGECVAGLQCGPGTVAVNGQCLPGGPQQCGPGLIEVDGECTPATLEPGHFLAPLIPLDEVADVGSHTDEVHIRTEDNLLLNCSYTFNVIDATDPGRMRVLSEGNRHVIPGETQQPGCKHLAWDGNLVFTTHLGNIRDPAYLSGWDITDPRLPVQLPVLQEEGIAYEGIAVSNGNIFVGLHENGLGVYDFEPGTGFTRIGSLGGFTNAWGIAARDNHVFVADGLGGFAIVDATAPTQPVELGRVEIGGQARGVVVDGNFAYVAAGSAGVVIVDISNPATPQIASRIEMPGTALRVSYSAPHLAVAAWNDARIYDVSTPASPRFVAAVRVPRHYNYADKDRELPTHRIFGVAINAKDVFVGAWENPFSYRLEADRMAPNMRLPETTARLDFGKLAVGETRTVPFEVTNQGTAPLTIVETWIHGDAFTVTPKQARIEPNESVTLEITYEATKTTEPEIGYLNIVSDDPATPHRKAYLIGNSPGLTIGDPLPATTGVMLDATSWNSEDYKGKVLLLTYFGTFCPVCANHLPDIEERFWQGYKDRGLEVVALNPREADDPIAEVQAYVERIRVTYPTGIEEPADTYAAITSNFVGPNPFPVDVLVDKEGIVRYATHEYDPDGMVELLEQLLAE